MSGKGRLILQANTMVCDDVELDHSSYDITIGDGCVINPRCSIKAISGHIVIGENNILEECTVIENSNSEHKTMNIGSMNLFEVGCKIINSNINNLNVFEPKSIVNSCVVHTGCAICSMVQLPMNTIVEDNTVYFLVNDVIRNHSANKLKEQHMITLKRYLDLMKLPNSKTCLKNNFKLKA